MQGSAFRDDVSQVTLGLTMLLLLVYATRISTPARQHCSDVPQCNLARKLVRFLVTNLVTVCVCW